MKEYETVCVFQPDLPATRIDKVKEKVQKMLASKKADVLDYKDWGKRKLAYRIGQHQFGYYIYFNYIVDGPFVGEVDHLLKLEEGVLRFLTVRLAENVSSKASAKKVSQLEDFKLTFDEPRSYRDDERSAIRPRTTQFKGGGYAEKKEKR